MDINIEEQEAKLDAEDQRIAADLIEIRNARGMLEKKEQALVNESFRNQGARAWLKSLNGTQPTPE